MSQKGSSGTEKAAGDLDDSPPGNTLPSRKSATHYKTNDKSREHVATRPPSKSRCLLTQLESNCNQFVHLLDGVAEPSMVSHESYPPVCFSVQAYHARN